MIKMMPGNTSTRELRTMAYAGPEVMVDRRVPAAIAQQTRSSTGTRAVTIATRFPEVQQEVPEVPEVLGGASVVAATVEILSKREADVPMRRQPGPAIHSQSTEFHETAVP
jgi:hypothetical protein